MPVRRLDAERRPGGAARPIVHLLTVAACALAVPGARAGDRLAPGARACLACHVPTDVGGDGAIPDLAGMPASEITAALFAYRSGARDGTVMPRLARGFSDDEIRAIAASLGRPETTAP